MMQTSGIVTPDDDREQDLNNTLDIDTPDPHTITLIIGDDDQQIEMSLGYLTLGPVVASRLVASLIQPVESAVKIEAL